jgi:hypothetical protein
MHAGGTSARTTASKSGARDITEVQDIETDAHCMQIKSMNVDLILGAK